jgi:thioredoxin 1
MDITKAQFEDITKTGVVLIDFHANWCGPCKMLGPILERVATAVTGATIAKVNVDDEKELASQFGIRSIPAMLFFKNGELVDRIVGMRQEAELTKKLNDLLSEG